MRKSVESNKVILKGSCKEICGVGVEGWKLGRSMNDIS